MRISLKQRPRSRIRRIVLTLALAVATGAVLAAPAPAADAGAGPGFTSLWSRCLDLWTSWLASTSGEDGLQRVTAGSSSTGSVGGATQLSCTVPECCDDPECPCADPTVCLDPGGGGAYADPNG